MLVDTGDIVSQSPEPQSVSGAGLNTEFVSQPPTECGHSYRNHCRSAGGLPCNFAELGESCLWTQSGGTTRHSKSQKNSQAGPNIPLFEAMTFYLSK
jgi:hypothetical protein